MQHGQGQGGLSGRNMANALKRLAREMARSCGAGVAGRAAPGASPGGEGHLPGSGRNSGAAAVLSPRLLAEGKVELAATANKHRDVCGASQKRKAKGTSCLCRRPACPEAARGLAGSLTACKARRW